MNIVDQHVVLGILSMLIQLRVVGYLTNKYNKYGSKYANHLITYLIDHYGLN